MEIVRGRRTISVIKRGDSLMTGLIATKPLVSKYQNNSVIGSWTLEENHRIIYVQILTTLTNTPIASNNITSQIWKFNGVVISDTDSRFEKTVQQLGTVQVPAIKIKADIMQQIETTSSIEFSASVFSGGHTMTIHANITVIKENISANTYTAYIIDQNSRGATITQQFPTVVLEAVLEKGGIIQTANTYQWYKMTLDPNLDLTNDNVADHRMLLPGKTTKTITLTAADIATYDTYAVDIFEAGQWVKTALISVRDETDVLELMFNVTGNESALDIGETVVYTPKVVLRGTTTQAAGNWTYKYQKIKTDGTLVGTQTTGGSYTVTYAEVIASGDGIDVLFEANEV
ncbi:hypothetical protein [Flavobacterium sp. NKUCC04_CG]|uniref:hypothetical protein n=1 Tax=Flavobacterium sp. NKUCC04_CG TaxID=2842121 RepID=UPI001C5B813D|nr:hypothetical protein [Flavobacterium sp. NKUCC04_CG]MBW3519525.1 hypothetical protein [Flavobacterium sp. NKUCC04_CG]